MGEGFEVETTHQPEYVDDFNHPHVTHHDYTPPLDTFNADQHENPHEINASNIFNVGHTEFEDVEMNPTEE